MRTTTMAWVGIALLGCGCSESHGGADAGVGDAAGSDAAEGDAAGTDGGVEPSDAGLSCGPNEQVFYPGCDEDPSQAITPGCYQTCAGANDASCGAGRSCREVTINPCVCPASEACCSACATFEWLCLADAGECAGRSYCDCTGGCVPLVDRAGGCLCPFDEPFDCSGEPGACVCGGAQYLGCAEAGRCAETELDCGTCGARMVDGCPECDPDCMGTCPPCVPPPDPECVGLGPCGCGPYDCPGVDAG